MQTIPCPLYSRSQTAPDQPLLIAHDQIITNQQFNSWVNRICDQWSANGLKPGDRVGLYRCQLRHAIAALLACWRLRLIAVVLNDRWPHNVIEEHCSDLSLSSVDSRVLVRCQQDAFSESSSPEQPSAWVIDEDGPAATMMFTSGSTGSPKLAVHRLANHYWNALGVLETFPLTAQHRWLINLPLYHVGGMSILFRVLLSEAAMVEPAPDQQWSDVNTDALRVTHVSLVPTQLAEKIKSRVPFGENITMILVGGAPCPQATLSRAVELGLPVHLTYGMTEMSSQVMTTQRIQNSQCIKPQVLPYRCVTVSEDGEVLVKGKTLFMGYLREDGSTQCPVTETGWWPTGDLGEYQADGSIRILGRRDDVMISGGENIHPDEIESQLLALPAVRRASVFAVANTTYGQRPWAVVDIDPDWPITEAGLRSVLASQLPAFKIPDVFIHWPVTESISPKTARRYFMRQVDLNDPRWQRLT
jgi:O-succinylbenzoic acid--CoA ligase